MPYFRLFTYPSSSSSGTLDSTSSYLFKSRYFKDSRISYLLHISPHYFMSCVELLFPPTATLPQIKFSFSYILSILACCFLRHVFICPLDHSFSIPYSLFVTKKRERTAPTKVRSFSHTQVLQKQVQCRVMP